MVTLEKVCFEEVLRVERVRGKLLRLAVNHQGFTLNGSSMAGNRPFSLSLKPSLMSARLVILPPCVPFKVLLYCSMLAVLNLGQFTTILVDLILRGLQRPDDGL